MAGLEHPDRFRFFRLAMIDETKRRAFLFLLSCLWIPQVLSQQEGSVIEFGALEFHGFEDERSGQVEVVRSGSLDSRASVSYLAEEHIARSGIDFVAASGVLDFAPGESSAAFSVEFLDDHLAEGSEPILLSLSGPSPGAIVGERSRARLYIQDNEYRGTLIDRSFQSDLDPRDRVRDMALLPDGRIVAAGEFRREDSFFVDRIIVLGPDGVRDPSFTMSGGIPDSAVMAVAVQPDGKILAGGYFGAVGSSERARIARFDPDGSLDASFDPGSGFGGPGAVVFDIEARPDGSILASGIFSEYDGQPHGSLIRLLPDGSPDPGFDLGDGIASTDDAFESAWISVVLPQPDGRILVSGHFNEIDEFEREKIARLEADGSVDQSFHPGDGASGYLASIEAMALHPDGRIMIGGDFDEYDRHACTGIARLHSDGTFDDSFDAGTGAEFLSLERGEAAGWVGGLHVYEDGRVLMIGAFETVDEFARPGIARLSSSGAIDGDFGPYGGTTYHGDLGHEEFSQVHAMIPLEDGRVVVGSDFRTAEGYRTGRISRLLWRNRRQSEVEFLRSRQIEHEGEGAASVRVIRRGESSSSFTVGYGTSDLSARSGSDYAAQEGILAFGELETEKLVELDIVADGLVEEDESLALSLWNPSPETELGEPSQTAVVLVDSLRTGNPAPGFDAPFIGVLPASPLYPPVARILPQEGGGILVSGNFSEAGGEEVPGLVRLLPDGRPDTGYRPRILDEETVGYVGFFPMAPTPDGGLVGGRGQLRLLDGSGLVDGSFEPPTTYVTALAALEDGSILAANNFLEAATGRELNEILLLDPQGRLDQGYLSPYFDNWVNVIEVLPDGSMLAGGWFEEADGEQSPGLVRLLSDGSPDEGFDAQLPAGAAVFSLAVDSEDRILVGGQFSAQGVPYPNLIRLLPDGSVDPSFSLIHGANLWVLSVVLDPEERILLGGGFTEAGGIPRPGLARLEADGAVDLDFAPDLAYFVPRQFVSAVALQEDGRILIGGSFSEVSGLPYSGLARLNGGSAYPGSQAGPLVLSIGRAGTAPGRVRIEAQARPGLAYRFEFSEDLSVWSELSTGVAQEETVAVEDQAGGAARFYRAVRADP